MVLRKGEGLVDVNLELSEEGKGEITVATLVRLPSHVSLQVQRLVEHTHVHTVIRETKQCILVCLVL